MPDGKALQLGTSHNLGQGFAKVFDIKYLGKDEKNHLPWQSSWGFSTRLIGSVVMQHSDDKGLVLPPKIAPIKAVIVPILFDKTKKATLKKAEEIRKSLKGLVVELDDREGYSAGFKFNEWEMKGVPVRIEIGPKDIEKKQVVLVRRDTGEKKFVKIDKVAEEVKALLEDIQNRLYDKAKKHLDESVVKVKSYDELMKAVKQKRMGKANFCGEIKCEEFIKEKSGGVTSRCIDFKEKAKGKCAFCDKEAKHVVVFGRNY